jgi:AhpD family alkylhydroperoxidase
MSEKVLRAPVKTPFNKRTYSGLGELAADLAFPLRNLKRLRRLKARGLVPFSFQERLMLAVTIVNGCRYCSYFHARQALKSGIGSQEVKDLLSGTVDNCPEDEALAVLYAQHWAESNGRPDSGTTLELRQRYGSEKAEAILLMLRMIRIANLLGNSFDYVLYRLSFGKWGS